jgi:hypothetical protein
MIKKILVFPTEMILRLATLGFRRPEVDGYQLNGWNFFGLLVGVPPQIRDDTF